MAEATAFMIGVISSIALAIRLCSLSQSLNLTIASPTAAVASRISMLNELSTAFKILNTMFNPLPIAIRRMSITAKSPLKDLLSLSALSPENTRPLESLLTTSRKLRIAPEVLEKSNVSRNASFKAFTIETSPWMAFLIVLMINSFPVGFSRLDKSSFKGVPVFSASSASSRSFLDCSSVYPMLFNSSSENSLMVLDNSSAVKLQSDQVLPFRCQT